MLFHQPLDRDARLIDQDEFAPTFSSIHCIASVVALPEVQLGRLVPHLDRQESFPMSISTVRFPMAILWCRCRCPPSDQPGRHRRLRDRYRAGDPVVNEWARGSPRIPCGGAGSWRRPMSSGSRPSASMAITSISSASSARTEQWAAGGELRKRLLAAFATHGIEIPRPQRVVLTRDGARPVRTGWPGQPGADPGRPVGRRPTDHRRTGHSAGDRGLRRAYHCPTQGAVRRDT